MHIAAYSVIDIADLKHHAEKERGKQVEMDEEERAMVAEGAASRENGAPPAAAAPEPSTPADPSRPADDDDDDNMRIVRDYKRPDARSVAQP